jgi:UDP-N-acetylglucosamine transferase subunit ALG13
MTTFVSVGNATQPFGRLLAAVEAIAASLPQPVIVQSGRNEFSSTLCEVRPFLSMVEFAEQVESADLLIFHAGAGSIIHAAQAGKVPVVMPRRAGRGEIIDDHQVELAAALSRAGKVILASEASDLAAAVTLARQLHGQAAPIPAAVEAVRTALATAAQGRVR